MHDVSLTLEPLVAIAGARRWAERMEWLSRQATSGQRVGRALVQRHVIEITLEKLRQAGSTRTVTEPERALIATAGEVVAVYAGLSTAGRAALRAVLRAGLDGEGTLVPLFHLMRIAALQRARGFEVRFAGLEDAAPFDLLIRRAGIEAEIACDVVSAEEGRDVHRGAWVRLVDAIDPDLQTWLADHPGRYLLKLTLPQGLRATPEPMAALHQRIRFMLAESRRSDHDEAAVLRLDPLMLAAAQLGETALMPSLRREFGPEAHLAVTASGGGVFVLAARAGREDEVAVAIRRRMSAIAPARLTGTRPGILAMFVEDTDRTEWRALRERLELEGETRQFLTNPEARRVVAVSCSSRLELFGGTDEELRFRNPAHPAAKAPALAPAVLSSL